MVGKSIDSDTSPSNPSSFPSYETEIKAIIRSLSDLEKDLKSSRMLTSEFRIVSTEEFFLDMFAPILRFADTSAARVALPITELIKIRVPQLFSDPCDLH